MLLYNKLLQTKWLKQIYYYLVVWMTQFKHGCDQAKLRLSAESRSCQRLEGKTRSLLVQLLEAAYIPWVMIPLLCFQSQKYSVFRCLNLLSPLFTYEDLCDYIGPT